MTVYAIADVEVLDPSLAAKYRAHSQNSLAKYGGRYIVRGGAVETLEGDWSPKIMVVVEFPTMERAHEWYASPEYAEALKYRSAALKRDLIFVEGVPPQA
jgi:uncharacterized protein (DUF1330 family)